MNTSIEFSQLLPWFYIASLITLSLTCAALAYARPHSNLGVRSLLLLLVSLLILNPITLQEMRQPLKNKTVIVVDESGSQKIADRKKVTEDALNRLTSLLEKMPGMDTPIIIRSNGSNQDNKKGESTHLFSDLRDSLAGLPLGQIAGTIFISDGQIHDVPQDIEPLKNMAPFHILLSGAKNEFDRKVTIVSAPKYGLLSDTIQISIKVDQYGLMATEKIKLHALQDGTEIDNSDVMPGEVKTFEFKLDHPGQNVFEFSIPANPKELTSNNNSAPVIINGVRDRLRVLLVSGAPHMGERAWRDLLKSDPSIDLIHFTILRSMNSLDNTPPRELSLIEFPVDELFQKKINDFDLIIFDRYQELSLMRPIYFTNIASFVKNGGGLLLALNSSDADSSIFNTALNDVLPAEPSSPEMTTLQKKFTPEFTSTGKSHPVTHDLPSETPWGPWFSQADIRPLKGNTLINGIDQKPLLILDKVNQGRVALLSSDNIWLWAKDAANGGPYTPLLRNLAHWLMKEPELEEDYIKAEVKSRTIHISTYPQEGKESSVNMKYPSGEEKTIPLTLNEKGRQGAVVEVEENGIYIFSNTTKKTFVAIGNTQSEEYDDVHTTDKKIRPVLNKTGGAAIWLKETPEFTLRTVDAASKNNGGATWIGLKENAAYITKDTKINDLIPNIASIALLLIAMLFTWRHEGR